jgi:hypothetical protein
MPTFAANVLPSSTGFDLGSAAQRWDAFLQQLNVSDIATFTAGTTFGLWNNVRVIDGSKYPKTQAGFEEAVTDTPSTGGIIIFDTVIPLSTSLTINKPIRVIGHGTNYDGTPASGFSWSGSTGGTILRINSGASALQGGGLENFQIDATGLGAGIAVHATSIQDQLWQNPVVINAPNTSTAFKIDTLAAINSSKNKLIGLRTGNTSGSRPKIALHLTNTSNSNCSHNTFIGLNLIYHNGGTDHVGLLDEGNDNNGFYDTFIFSPSGGSGKGVLLQEANSQGSRGEYFYHLEPDKGMTADGALTVNNWVFGYDTDNAQPLPTITNSAELFIMASSHIGGGSVIPVRLLGIGDNAANADDAAQNIGTASLRLVNGSENAFNLKAAAHANVWRFRPLNAGSFSIGLTGTGDPLVISSSGKTQLDRGVEVDGSGFKHTRIASGTTAGSLHDIASATWTFGTAFADSNYTITCTIDNPTGVPVVAYTENKAAASIDIVIIAGSAAAASGTLNCTAVHD